MARSVSLVSVLCMIVDLFRSQCSGGVRGSGLESF